MPPLNAVEMCGPPRVYVAFRTEVRYSKALPEASNVMATMVQPIVRVRELTREEAWAMFDSTAQFLLEMSGAEALRRIESGDVRLLVRVGRLHLRSWPSARHHNRRRLEFRVTPRNRTAL